MSEIEARLEGADWSGVAAGLDERGWSILPALVSPAEAEGVAALYAQDDAFRSRVEMSSHGFGRGEYKYFRYPLPALVESLRAAAYRRLAPIANRWRARLGGDDRFPDRLAGFLDRCHAAGQTKPTPLLLAYGPGDYNCLHRDLYGDEVFPLQVAILLDEPGKDFTGGEFVMTEQRPRRQSRAMVLPLRLGDAAVFAVAGRPVSGLRGDSQAKLSHGVSQVWSGRRRTLGVIFHDAA